MLRVCLCFVFRNFKAACLRARACSSVSVSLFWNLPAAVGQILSRPRQNLVYLVLTAVSILFQRVTRLFRGHN